MTEANAARPLNTIKPEYAQILDTIRNLYIQCGAKLTEHAPSLWGINPREKAKLGNIVIELDHGAPIFLWTPDGSLHITGSYTAGDAEAFRSKLEEACQVEAIEDPLQYLEMAMPENYGEAYRPVYVRISPKEAKQ